MSSLNDADLVVLSHLSWEWVWQRPQHLISRIARGRRTLFVEEPVGGEVSVPTLRVRDAGPVTRVWLELPEALPLGSEFSGAMTPHYTGALQALLHGRERDVWLYTPATLQIAEALQPRLLAYDVMDDLSSFAHASPELELSTRRALNVADVVFAGGRSLQRGAAALRPGAPVHLYPSGVDCDHYEQSRTLRRPAERPVAGYVGVIDERLDLDVVAGLAAQLPGWDIHMVGPSMKIDPDSLPQAPNIHYLGQQPYTALPEVMARFDVALMPFALNEATRSISPTKTLEYLAAGLPVVSTRVPDVVADWSSVVHLADDCDGFAAACREVRAHSRADRDRAVAPLQARHEWDAIAASMRGHLEEALASASGRAAA